MFRCYRPFICGSETYNPVEKQPDVRNLMVKHKR